jgi:hypothetical protein
MQYVDVLMPSLHQFAVTRKGRLYAHEETPDKGVSQLVCAIQVH